LFVIALSGSRASAGPAQAPAGTPPISEQARQLAAAGQTSQAIQLLQTELGLHPSALEPRLTLAEIYLSQRDRARAESEFREALAHNPGSERAALALGQFYLSTAAWAQAQQVFGDLLRSHPQLAEARWQLTLALAGDHQYAEADRTLTAVPLPAGSAERTRYYRTAASIHSGLGDKKRAAQDMEKALQAAPQDESLQMLTALTEADASDWIDCAEKLGPLFLRRPTARVGLLLLRARIETNQDFRPTLAALRDLSLPADQDLELRLREAELLAQSGHHPEAAEELARALALSTSDRNVAFNLAVERYAAGEVEPAFEQLVSLRQDADSAQVEDLLAEIEEQRGNSADAVRDHENAVRLAPSEESYRLALGTALLRAHAYQRAEDVFQQAIQSFPASSRSYVGLALAEYMMEQYESSATAFLRGDELDGHSGRILNYLGSTQMESPSGPSPQAIDTLCARAKAQPRDPVAVKWCGALLFRKSYLAGDQPGSVAAIAHLRSAAILAPRDPLASCFLGRALFWDQKLAEARHWLEACVRMQPDSPEEHYRLSLVYQQLNLRDDAAKQAALAETLKEKAGGQSLPGEPLALDLLQGPPRPALYPENGEPPASFSPQNQ
jgi:tetratricopeptide (TPR) repeat protein